MGCNNSIDIKQMRQKFIIPQQDFKVGKLKIKILDCDFIQEDNLKQKYLQIKISNQSYTTSIHHNFGLKKGIKIDQTYNFVINSKNKKYGRMIIIEIWSKQDLRADKEFAIGIVDLDPFINKKSLQKELNPQENKIKCYLNYQKTAAGKVHLTAEFIPYQYKKVTMKIDSVIIRQHFIRERPVYVRITIGEDIFQTAEVIETFKQPPKWEDQFHVFYVPQFLSQCLIEVLQKNKANSSDILIGELKLDLKSLISLFISKAGQNYSEDIQIDEQITGALKFQVFEGQIQSSQKFPEIGSPKKISKRQKKILTSLNVIKDQINQKTNDKIVKVKQKKLQRTFTIQSSPIKLPSLKQSKKQSQKILKQKNEQEVQNKKSLYSKSSQFKIQPVQHNIENKNQIKDNEKSEENTLNKISKLKIKEQSFILDKDLEIITEPKIQFDNPQISTAIKTNTKKQIEASNLNQKVQNYQKKDYSFYNSIVNIDLNKKSEMFPIFQENIQEISQKTCEIGKQSHRKLLQRQKSEAINDDKLNISDEWQKCQINNFIK